jgi:diguanylate cyclase
VEASKQDGTQRSTQATGSDEEPLTNENNTQAADEPSYSVLNEHIRAVLTELLDQIEPPPLAKDNYQAARKQIAAGLPWYELVPTLEDISLVVVSSFDFNQRDFEQYLGTLNSRLTDAYEFINQSQQFNEHTSQDSQVFNEAVRDQMSAMRASVESATELDQLKVAISSKLDQLVSVMDKHQIDEIEREATLSDQLNVLVERVKLMESDSKLAEQRIEEQRQKALRDVLTQLPNREAYQLRLEQEFDRWRRYGRPLSIVVGDIDHFKHINDEYGHLAGDKVLRIISKSLAKRLRKTDFIARYGGEEFVILMPETSQQQALKVIEGVREAIASCPFHFKDQPVSLTMSFGVTEFNADDEPELGFARADKALYSAKDGGRNCCVLAPLVAAASSDD